MKKLYNTICRRTTLQLNELGQSTAEYALVILGAAAVALLLITWASSTGSITNLFESIISRVGSKVS